MFTISVQGLRDRVRALRTDLDFWVDRTSPGRELAQHHKQVARLRDYLHGVLEAALDGTPVDLTVAPPFSGSVDDVPDLRRDVGSVHLLWDFFRDKFAQRDVDAFTAHLGAADGLASACYEPFVRAATERAAGPDAAAAVKEPPLVFYSIDRTPFAQARTKTLHPPGLDSEDLKVFAPALQRLPVPVIGLPWELANRMPETTLIGHEAGHVIAEDLGLGREAATAIAEATFAEDPDGTRKRCWVAWCDEVFADVIGVLATGGAFVDGLSTELTAASNDIRLARIDTKEPGDYPTAALRVALCQHVLERVGVAPSPTWSATYGQIVGDARDYAGDVTVVVDALLERSWTNIGDRRLSAVLPWSAQREAAASALASTMLDGGRAPDLSDVRTCVAASMHAYRENPGLYAERKLDTVLAEAVVALRTEQMRFSEATRNSMIEADPALEESGLQEAQRAADRRAGAALARQMGLGHGAGERRREGGG
jgi:hypothetical protein